MEALYVQFLLDCFILRQELLCTMLVDFVKLMCTVFSFYLYTSKFDFSLIFHVDDFCLLECYRAVS